MVIPGIYCNLSKINLCIPVARKIIFAFISIINEYIVILLLIFVELIRKMHTV